MNLFKFSQKSRHSQLWQWLSIFCLFFSIGVAHSFPADTTRIDTSVKHKGLFPNLYYQALSPTVSVEDIIFEPAYHHGFVPVDLPNQSLRAYPEGSLARAYLAFMEGENLTPEGLRGAAEEADIDYDAYPEFAEMMRLFLHLQVSHDLWHVLSGYGRDALGELCNLVFTRQQTKNPGFRLIVLIGGIAIKLDDWSVPTMKALKEAGRNARRTEWILEHDVETLLALPLAEARARLNIGTPAVYNAIPDAVKARLLKPKVQQTQTERERAARERAALQSA